ncbi:peptidase inhibitor family I36 protein [Streptomyces sp. HNM0574]|uniref:peptidase inhibitor family I36 protein n=1 Tax=Streptomyces sp. HNM0574 TaxID=2714954 RepID=UPI00146F6141|nr:peptidase inhibitor family I36 protein [Streptomyces sp. HNM0574]NLU68247.1 hypothetical protein [Streptomyces sp. HNM0574]
MKRAGLLVAAGLMALGAASTASAAPDAVVTGKGSCPKGYVCVWNNDSFSGSPDWKSQGNIGRHKSSHGLSGLNNGVRQPGADHVHYTYQYAVDDRPRNGCLHYPGDSPSSMTTLDTTVTLHSAKWGGEC